MIADKDQMHSEYLNLLRTVRLNSFPEIDLSKALYLDSLYIFDLNWIKVLKALIRSWFFKTPELDVRIRDNSILMLTTIHARYDHDSYWNSIKKLFPVKDEIILNDRFIVKEYLKNISLRGIAGKMRSYRNAYSALKVIENKSHRSYLASKIITCEKYINEINDQAKNTKVVIAFCDTFLFENVMIQFMHNQGAVCITTQHGQPVFRGWDKDHLNQSQIFNFSSDYYMAKGNYSKKQFVKAGFDERKIIVLGSMNKEICKLHFDDSRKIFGVFTDCVLYDFASDTNKKLIHMAEEISEKLNMSYFIKIHPSDTLKNYHGIVTSGCMGIYKDEYPNEELFGKIEFGIMSASAIYLDMLYSNVKCYQMKTEIEFPIVESQDDIFESCDQFMDKIDTWRHLPVTEKDMYFTEQQKEYGFCENTGQRIQAFVESFL